MTCTNWNTCERADEMLTLALYRGVPLHTVAKATAACAREALVFVPEGEDRPRLAIEAVERGEDQDILDRVMVDACQAYLDLRNQGNRSASSAASSAGSNPLFLLGLREGNLEQVDQIECAVEYAVNAGCTHAQLADAVRRVIPELA